MTWWTVLTELVAWTLGRRQRLRVQGESMTPTLWPGDFVLVHWQPMPPAHAAEDWVGAVVVAHHSDVSTDLIKRVGGVVGDDGVILLSDNPEAGTDSRQWGPFPHSAIRGRVVLILSEPRRSLLAR